MLIRIDDGNPSYIGPVRKREPEFEADCPMNKPPLEKLELRITNERYRFLDHCDCIHQGGAILRYKKLKIFWAINSCCYAIRGASAS